jgi:F-type H+-transporting ATPase subunit a
MKKLLTLILAILLPMTALPAQEAAADSATGTSFDMNEYLYGHVRDAYEWHITTINGKAISIPLPVIVRSKTTGWHVFSSRRLEDGEYEGLYVAPQSSKYANKVVERGADGAEVRPLDFSITKNVCGLLINSALLLFIVLGTAKWYRKHDATEEVPKGGVGFMEMLVSMIEDDVIKESVGEEYKKYSPYLLTAFFFIFLNNLMGIVPFFPGGANITGNIAVTFVLAMFTFFIVNVFGNKQYWKDILWPEVPTWLKVPVPLMRGAFHDTRRSSGHILDGSYGGSTQWRPGRRVRLAGSVHGLPGTPGGIHSGVCIYNAFGCVHWPFET